MRRQSIATWVLALMTSGSFISGIGNEISATRQAEDPQLITVIRKVAPPQISPDDQKMFAGMLAAIDPSGAGFRPLTPQEVRELDFGGLKDRMARAPLRREVRPDGTLVVHLGNRFLNASVARLSEEGSLTLDCISPRQFPHGSSTPTRRSTGGRFDVQ